jgi:hypothetical protein
MSAENTVRITGTLTKDPYVAAKGWVGATLAVKKAGTDYAVWVSLYAPSGDAANSLKNASSSDRLTIEGELDEGKDKDGNKKLQVKVIRATQAAAPVAKREESVFITDEDIPF